MLKSLIIENFRCFPHFKLSNLGRINLLVGKNNSGKSSILEAIQILQSADKIEALVNIMKERGEYILEEAPLEYDISHLFYGHGFEMGEHFRFIKINDEKLEAELSVKLDFIQPKQLSLLQENIDENMILDELRLVIQSSDDKDSQVKLPITINGGLSSESLRRFGMRYRTMQGHKQSNHKVQMIPASALNSDDVIELFEQIVLTPGEELVLKSIQGIEPEIERIVSVRNRRSARYKQGFVLRLKNCDQRVPIGSMGDGIWRILGLALSIVNAKDGILLIDEIDTGLHYTAMDNMWKMIWQTANDLNVQVFATTHSNDCWKSLAELASNLDDDSDGIAIHRIEKERNHSISYSEEEMIAALEENYEVRGA